MNTLVFGHKNPDTDSVCASISYAYLKNRLNDSVEPRVLGALRNEARFVLNYFDVQPPKYLDNVMIQAKDLKYEKVPPLMVNSSIHDTFITMEKEKIHTLPIVDEEHKLIGIVSMQDIASGLFYASFGYVDTTYLSLMRVFSDNEVKVIVPPKNPNTMKISGNLEIFDYNSFKENKVSDKTVVVLKPNYSEEFFDKLNEPVALLILSNFDELTDSQLRLLKKLDITTISVNLAIPGIVTEIVQSKSIESIMNRNKIVTFSLDDYLSDIKDVTLKTKFRNYPLLDYYGKYVGLIGRRHLIRPGKKNVILVDHNEFHQSATGIEEANILEVIDHHRIGGIKTVEPIQYISKTVGSTCSIIHQMFIDSKVEIPYKIAGLLISGILSDTLYFKSPTCTKYDIDAANSLNSILKLDLDEYTSAMFKEGSSIKNLTLEQIVNGDLKEFAIKGKQVAIAQVFTMDIEYIESIKDELLSYLKDLSQSKGYHTALLIVTDIIKEGSYIYYHADQDVIKSILNTKGLQGDFVPYLVSRKKQILPEITRAFEEIY